MTEFSRPADGRVDEDTPDIAGFISIGLGVVSTMGCMGSCVPYIGGLFMLMSWMTIFLGIAAGAVGLVIRKQAEVSATYSGVGLAMNFAIMLLWVVYFVVVFGLVAVFLGAVIAAENM